MKPPLDHGGQGTVHRPCGQITQDEHPCRDEGTLLITPLPIDRCKNDDHGGGGRDHHGHHHHRPHDEHMCEIPWTPMPQTSQVYIHPLSDHLPSHMEHVRPGKGRNQGKAGNYKQPGSFCSRFPISELFTMSDYASSLPCPRKVRVEGMGAFCRQNMLAILAPGSPGGDDLRR